MPKGRKLLQDMDDEAMAPAPSRRLLQDMDDEAMAPAPSRRLLQDMDDEAMAPAPMRRRLLNNGATYSAAHKTVLIPKTLYPKP
jgi:hypothetical protein